MALYDNLKNLIAGATLYADTPLGTINAFGGTTAPEGWLLCQGQTVSRTAYADLFAVIGTAFGIGDGSTTFNLPDFRESVPKGAGLTGNSSNHLDSDGLAVGEFIDDRVQTHTHTIVANCSATTISASSGHFGDGAYTLFWGNDATKNNSGRNGDTTEVKAVGVNYIIKAVQAGIPQDILEQIDALIDARNLITFGG